ncbi:type II toxin-antitoxin system prevent-host-death family antitoxin [Nocardiopsis sp. NPDC049922]|uniref:type II toxin-antitoxin system Phd/YefM family antitoxin n=1 Tax=Nocardiopsis sp. NPDC049922 TaxID=3155157 RepID=UPI0033DAA522
MRTMTDSEFRADHAAVLDSVVEDREEVVVTGTGREPVVLVTLREYEALRETVHLLRCPENARRLATAIEELESGHGVERSLGGETRPGEQRSAEP